MFYQQRKQTAPEEALEQKGPWPWQPAIAALQRVLTHCLVGLSQVAKAGLERGIETCRTGAFTAKALVATHGDAAADPHRLVELIQQAVVLRDQLKERISALDSRVAFPPGPADFEPATTFEGLLRQAGRTRLEMLPAMTREVRFLKQFLLAGIRGLAAYADHAHLLGHQDTGVSACLWDSLATIRRKDLSPEDLSTRLLACGRAAYKAMSRLDTALVSAYGEPEPAAVPLGPERGAAVLISGRDFRDLEALLKQTEDSGIRVYSHGEMLDAHQYPGLKCYPQFYGHDEGPGPDAGTDVPPFPGPVVLTAGSPVPFETGSGRNLFTSGPLNRPGFFHISHRNFTPVIDRALAMPGFSRGEDRGKLMVGSRPGQIARAADRIAQWVKDGGSSQIRFATGCGGSNPPGDARVMFQSGAPGEAGRGSDAHSPIDLGHCCDPRIIVRIIDTLSVLPGIQVGALPLSLQLSCRGQKAAGVLLALIFLGLRDIDLGPALPTGITAGQSGILRDRFGIRF